MKKQDDIEWGVVGMNVRETAKALRVSVRTVRDLLSSGELDSCARFIGREWRISFEGLQQWLQRGGGRKLQEGQEEDETQFEPDED